MLSALNPAVPFGDPRFTLVDAETVDSFEVGAKTALLNRKLYLDGALFFYKYDNFQTLEQEGTTFVTTNAGKAESYGLEAQLRYDHSRDAAPVRQLRLQSRPLQKRRARRQPLPPGARAHLLARPDLGDGRRPGPARFHAGGDLSVEGLLRRQQRHSGAAAAAGDAASRPIQDEFQDGYALVSARLGYALAGGRYRAELFVENLFDKKYIKDAGNTGDALGLPTFIAGEPRTYGIQLTGRF